MIEWAEWDKFNSFNSWKGLLYADWYKGIAEGKIFPPIEASIDPIHACNLDCKHCNAVRYRRENPQKMTDEHLFNLIDFLSEWGVKANCFGGGGEPTMHPGLSSALLYSKAKGMESSLSTNGTIMSDKLADAIIETCRWIGISVDAASGGTYEELKGTNLFGKVLDNIKKLVKLNEKDKSCDINYKFLISPINQHEIYEACSIARDLGVRDFQARPMDYNHQGMGELRGVFGEFDMTSIRTQLEACHSFSNSTSILPCTSSMRTSMAQVSVSPTVTLPVSLFSFAQTAMSTIASTRGIMKTWCWELIIRNRSTFSDFGEKRAI